MEPVATDTVSLALISRVNDIVFRRPKGHEFLVLGRRSSCAVISTESMVPLLLLLLLPVTQQRSYQARKKSFFLFENDLHIVCEQGKCDAENVFRPGTPSFDPKWDEYLRKLQYYKHKVLYFDHNMFRLCTRLTVNLEGRRCRRSLLCCKLKQNKCLAFTE